MNKYYWETSLDYMDLNVYERDAFSSDGKLSISIHRKRQTSLCASLIAYHQRHIFKNYVLGKLTNYAHDNTEEILQNTNAIFLRLHNCGFRKYVYTNFFQHVTFLQRN